MIRISGSHLQLLEGNHFPYCNACSNYQQHGAAVCGSGSNTRCSWLIVSLCSFCSFVHNKDSHHFPAVQCKAKDNAHSSLTQMHHPTAQCVIVIIYPWTSCITFSQHPITSSLTNLNAQQNRPFPLLDLHLNQDAGVARPLSWHIQPEAIHRIPASDVLPRMSLWSCGEPGEASR